MYAVDKFSLLQRLFITPFGALMYVRELHPESHRTFIQSCILCENTCGTCTLPTHSYTSTANVRTFDNILIRKETLSSNCKTYVCDPKCSKSWTRECSWNDVARSPDGVTEQFQPQAGVIGYWYLPVQFFWRLSHYLLVIVGVEVCGAEPNSNKYSI